MDEHDKEWIDNASYEDMLRRLRFAPEGDRMFLGETGTYFDMIFSQKASKLGPEGHTRISKEIGWEPDSTIPITTPYNLERME